MHGPKRRILIVDDEVIVRELLADVLSDMDIEAITAESGFEALNLFTKPDVRFDLVVVDMCMPGMGGPEVCKELRKINPLQKIVIATGNYSTDDEIAELKTNGITNLIRKPFNMSAMLSLFNNLMAEGSDAQA